MNRRQLFTTVAAAIGASSLPRGITADVIDARTGTPFLLLVHQPFDPSGWRSPWTIEQKRAFCDQWREVFSGTSWANVKCVLLEPGMTVQVYDASGRLLNEPVAVPKKRSTRKRA